MIKFKTGNLLLEPVEALVNTVNTEGVMGKGIALQFKNAFPDMYKAYESACKSNSIQLGKVHVHDLGGLAGGPRWIINFPTKGHWRSKSRLQDVAAGLADLVKTIERLQIKSIAIPPLGCGNGGLNWNLVRPLIEQSLETLPDVQVVVFTPGQSPKASEMPNRTTRPTMTEGRAVLIILIEKYLAGLMDPMVTLLEIHKLMYLMQVAGQPLKLNFQKAKYGPYAPNLEKALRHIEGHFISGFGDGVSRPSKEIGLLNGSSEEANEFLASSQELRARLNSVTELIEGFEDAYGMELLGSTLWAMKDDADAKNSPEGAISYIHNWTERKRLLLKPDHIQRAWGRIREKGWA